LAAKPASSDSGNACRIGTRPTTTAFVSPLKDIADRGIFNRINFQKEITMSNAPVFLKTAVEQFRDAIADRGITPPDEIENDGKLHRFSTNGEPDDDAGWYVFRQSHVPSGSFGDFRTGKNAHWIADIGRPLSDFERSDFQKEQAEMRRQREADNVKRRAEAKDKANAILRISKPAPDDHPYLTRKDVKSHGLRLWKDLLLVPMRDESGEVQSLQFISGDGGKKFLKGGKMQGCFHVLGNLQGAKSILIAEGYATAATVYEATCVAPLVPTVVAFNAGNLLAVAKTIRAQHPNAFIFICADDDWRTEGNPGIHNARIAADAVGGEVIEPDFGCYRPDKATDFNDMADLHGKDGVACYFAGYLMEKWVEAAQAKANQSEDIGEADFSSPAAATTIKQAQRPATDRQQTKPRLNT
jgi:putative DNA primase/helicase